MNPMTPGAEQKYRIHYVRITNNGTVAFSDRHDGVPVTIEPGQSENLPLDMAAHFFGYSDNTPREVMFRHVCKRQGWNTAEHIKKDPATGKTLAESLFDNLDIRPVIYKMVEAEIDENEPIPADPQIEDEQLPPQKRAKAGAA